MITVNIDTVDYVVSATNVSAAVTVTADNSIFTVTNINSLFTVTNINPSVFFLTDGGGFDFAVKIRGEWISGATYTRNDAVRYLGSVYVQNSNPQVEYLSILPPNTPFEPWVLFYDHEATMTNLTVIGDGSIGGDLTVGGTGTFGGGGSFNGNLTVANTIATAILNANTATVGKFLVSSINNLAWPQGTGNYGQVLSTNGSDLAAWVNLGDLVFWSLSADLFTNGFNIVTGQTVGQPNPQLTIGSGVTGNLSSYIRFPVGGAEIRIVGDTTVQNDLTVGGNTVLEDTDVAQLTADTAEVRIRLSGEQTNINQWNPVPVNPGIIFPDGSVMTSAYIGTGTGGTGTSFVPIASATTLGVIRVGNNLSIDVNGILSATGGAEVEIATSETLGVIRVGSGLLINPTTGVLSVDPGTIATNISLDSDMKTNGFKIKFDATSDSFLDINSNNIRMQTDATRGIYVYSSSTQLEHPSLIELRAPITRVGSDIYNSRLNVGRIYNYEGTSAPLFPAGVQFGDQTIQITAYDDGRFDNGNIDFTNRSWQALLTYLQIFDFNDPNFNWNEPAL